MNKEQEFIEIQELYVDAVQIGTSPYTFRITVGKDTNGTFIPNVMLSMSPHFALQLHEALGKALEYYKESFADINLPKTE